jgi:hypothetical protein
MIELAIVSIPTNIMPKTNNNFDGHQSGSIFCEHVAQGPHIFLAKYYPHSSIYPHMQKGITFPFESFGFTHNTVPFLGC